MAEYRELPRLFKLMRAYHDRGGVGDDLPPTYRLGRGHVMFFYDKGGYLVRRQTHLIREMKRRGYRPQFDNPIELAHGIPDHLMKRWRPTEADQLINIARINDRGGLRLVE